MITNHHCAFSILQQHSTPERDLITHGFLARTPRRGAAGVRRPRHDPPSHDRRHPRGRGRGARRRGRPRALPGDRAQAEGAGGRVREGRAPPLPGGGVRRRPALRADRQPGVPGRAAGLRAARAPWATTAARSTTGAGPATPATSPCCASMPAPAASRRRRRRPTSPTSRGTSSPSRRAASSRTSFVMVAGYPGLTFRSYTEAEMRERAELFYPRRAELYRAWIDRMEAASKTDEAVRIALADRIKGLAQPGEELARPGRRHPPRPASWRRRRLPRRRSSPGRRSVRSSGRPWRRTTSWRG